MKKTLKIIGLLFVFMFFFAKYGHCTGAEIIVVVGKWIVYQGTVATLLAYVATAVSIGYSIYSSIMTDRLKTPGSKYIASELANTYSNEGVVPILYGGPIAVGGNVVWQTDPAEQVKRYLALCIGEVDEISSLKINEEAFGGFEGCSYTAYTGTSTQVVDDRSYGSVKGLRDIAYVALTLASGEKLKSSPVVTAEVKGRKIKTWNSSTENWDTNPVVWSNNPAAVVRDYLTLSATLGGAGLNDDYIDDESFGVVSEHCEEMIDDGQDSTEQRYNLDLMIDTRHSVLDNLAKMLITFNGGLIRSGTTYKLVVEKADKTAIVAFTEDNITRDSFVYGYGDNDDTPNQLGVEWIEPLEIKNPKRVEFVEDELDRDLRGKRTESVSCYGIIRQSQASRLAKKIMYEKKVNDIWCQFRANIEGLELEPGDVISVTHQRPNWTAALFRIVEIKEAAFGNSEYLCQAYNSSILDDRHATRYFDSWDYGVPLNPFSPIEDVSSLVLEEIGWRNNDGVHIAHIDVSWTLPSTGLEYLDSLIIDLKKGSENYITVGAAPSTATEYRINLNLEIDSAYTVRVRTKNKESITSDGTESRPLTLIGKDAAPSDVTSFIVKKYRDVLVCVWTPVSDVDVRRYEIRKGTSWASGKIVESNISKNEITLRDIQVGSDQSYWIKAIDNSGNYSENALEGTVTVGYIPFQNIIKTYDENDNWLDNSDIYNITGEDGDYALRRSTGGYDKLSQSFTPDSAIELKQIILRLKEYGQVYSSSSSSSSSESSSSSSSSSWSSSSSSSSSSSG